MISIFWPHIEASLGRKWKRQMVKRMGGSCRKCGYCKCPQALTFHHIHSKDKEIWITRGGGKDYLGPTPSREQLEAEIETKCVLLCCRCHAEVETGLWSIADLVQVAILTGVTIQASSVKFSLN